MSHRNKLAELEAKIARQEEEVREQKARLRKLARDAETRKKIIFGAAVISFLRELDDNQRNRLYARLQQYISRNSDREFLGLPPLPSDRADRPADPSR